MGADPEVMAHFPALLSRADSDALVGRLRDHFDRHGFGFWAVEAPGVAPFVGFVGLLHQSFDAPFAPAIEIGWRLARAHWGRGYAPEAAAEALRFGFEDAGADEIVSYTVPGNDRSQRVMVKLGMERDLDGDFDHPRLPIDSPLRRHVLYRLPRARWATAGRAGRTR